MRKILFLIFVLETSCPSWAESNAASWTNLVILQVGQKIQVVDLNSKKHSGTFVNVSDTALSYQETAGEQTIEKRDVRSVKLMQNKHRLRNALIVAAAGAGVGAGIGAATYHPCSPSQFLCIQPGGRAAPAGIGAAIGFAGGAVVGALLPGHKMIYNVSPR